MTFGGLGDPHPVPSPQRDAGGCDGAAGAVPQGTCAADLYRHPQLDADIEAVKEIYSENAVAVRWVLPVSPPVSPPATQLCHPWHCAGLTLSPRRVSHREYGTIDDVDIDLHVNISFLDVSPQGVPVALAWGEGDTRARGGPKFPSLAAAPNCGSPSAGGGGDGVEGAADGAHRPPPALLPLPVPRWPW